MANNTNSKVADNFDNEDCFDIEMLGKELGLATQRTRQVVNKAIADGKLIKLIKYDGPKILYAPPMVKQLKDLYESGKLGIKPRRRLGMTSAVLARAAKVYQVPVFDKMERAAIEKVIGDDQAVIKFIQEKLREVARPKMSEIERRKQAFAEEMAKLGVKVNLDDIG